MVTVTVTVTVRKHFAGNETYLTTLTESCDHDTAKLW
jgi:hypothetical protein